MVLALYQVAKPSDLWWITLEGARTGPYQSENDAVTDAIVAAKACAQRGHKAEVAVARLPHGNVTVYRSEQDKTGDN